MAVFFSHALAGGAIFPRIPDIQTGLGLTEGQLGLMLMGQPVGGLIAIAFSSFMIERIGPKRILSLAIPSVAFATFAVALAPTPIFGFLAMLCLGLSFSAGNTSMNVEADRLEAAIGKRIMNRCHGIWSLGFLTTTTLGGLARGLPLSPALHLGLMVPIVFAIVAIGVWPMQPAPPRSHDGSTRSRRILALPTAKTLVLSAVMIATIMPDVATRAWSVIYMRDTFDLPAWLDAMTLPSFMVMLTAGRLFGDRPISRFGPVRCALVLLCIAFSGLLLVLAAPGPYAALLGFAAMGLGLSIIFPLVITAAAGLGDRPASENVAAISLVNSMVALGTPPLLGFIAQGLSIRIAFATLVPCLVLAMIFSRSLAPRVATPD